MDKLLQLLASFFVVAMPVLYLSGQVSWSGYLSGLGVPEGLFPIGIEETLMRGFLVQSISLLSPLILTGAVLGALAMLLYTAHDVSKLPYFKKPPVNGPQGWRPFEASAEGNPVIEGLSRFTMRAAVAIALILVPVTAMVFSVDSLFKDGKNEAEERLRTPDKFSDITLDSGEQVSGDLITCGREHCAIHDGTKAVVLPLNSVDRITRSKPNEQTNK